MPARLWSAASTCTPRASAAPRCLRFGLVLGSLIGALLGGPPQPARAAEIDSLTGRSQSLRDSARPLERRLNAALERGVQRANERGPVCDEEALYDELRRELASPFIGHVLTVSLDEDETLDRRRVRRDASIYRDLGLFDNISVHWKDLSSVIRVGDTLIGVDKIGHYFVEGWSYFEIAHLDGEGIPAAMDWGEGTENSYFGFYTTGVRSNADLVANFEGLRFWLRVIAAGDDPLDAGWRARRPYVRCKRRFGLFGERRWKLVREWKARDYVNPAWDEATNCCAYRSEAIEAMVMARIALLEAADGEDYGCPLDPEGCVRARERYGPWAPRLLHPACLTAQPPDRPWWRFW